MIMTITPLVEVASARTAKLALLSHGLGLLLGAQLTFGLLGAAGTAARLDGRSATSAAGWIVLLLLVLASLGRLPQSAWQVPTGWMGERRRAGAFAYGVFLGTGVATKAPYGSWLAVLVLAFLADNPGAAISAGAAYAVGRWVPVALSVLFPSTFPRQEFAFWLLRMGPTLRLADRSLLAIIGTLSVVQR